ncbi:hypothetical protein H0Z60_10015 [Ectothiorhodospiraceae bacterium WFHF3C12]|nr:hypothetical protein [Ectothiorhodospiraceae bacterium WFHF3C12]
MKVHEEKPGAPPEELRAKFERQRRNLIAICVVIVFYDHAQIEVSGISFLGAQIGIGHPQAIVHALWVAWFYFSVRYYQYFKAARADELWQTTRMAFDRFARRTILQHLSSGGVEWRGAPSVGDFQRRGLLRVGVTLPKYHPSEGKLDEGQDIEIPLWRFAGPALASLWYLTVHTPLATDVILPFILAVLAPLFWLSL